VAAPGLTDSSALTDSGAALRQAMALHRAGRVREADEQYAIVLRAEPSHPQALRLRGILARDAGDFDHSLRLLRKAVEVTDSDPEPAAELGLSYLAAGYLHLAEAAFRTALARDADSLKALANLGALLQYRGHIQASIDCHRRVLALVPDDLEVRCNLANTLVEAGRGDEALAECDTALAMAPDQPELLVTRGAVLCGLERYAQAIPVLEAALATGPDDMALINLGLACQQLGQTTAALAALTTAVRVNPDNARAAADLTTLLSAEGRGSEALALCAGFLARHPGERLVLAARAVALRDAGRAGEASELIDLERLVHVRELSLPRGFASLAEFNAGLAAAVLADPSLVDSPASKSTRGGSQTGEFNADQQPLLGALRDALDTELRAVIADWQASGHASHPAMAWATDHWTLRLWATVLGPGGYQLPHLHPLGWLSGVYYVQVPSGLAAEAGDAGALEFGQLPAPVRYTHEPERRIVPAVAGRLVVFPSYFHHRTLPFASREQRISIAFDVMPVR
jgi:uncharacterized protein (TIGR02466 family)